MNPNTPHNEETIDSILEHLSYQSCAEGFKTSDVYDIGYCSSEVIKAHDALTILIDDIVAEVIGEDVDLPMKQFEYAYHDGQITNALRRDARQRYAALKKERGM